MVDRAIGYDACATGGFFAVLKVTGDARQVLHAYEEQFAANHFSKYEDRTTRYRGDVIRRISYDLAGVGDLWAETVEGKSGRWLQLGRCND